MEDQWSRTRLLIGDEGLQKLRQAKVAVLGLGGVGGHAVEALARSGIGHLALIDGDVYGVSNLNRQIHALRSTIGRKKTDVVKERILEIDPEIQVTTYPFFFTRETLPRLPLADFDYVIDAIDMVSSKILAIETCHKLGVPIITAAGAGNKLHPEMVQVTDLAKTTMDPLARVLRKELKKRGILHVKIVYSTEEPVAFEEEVALNPTLTDEEGRVTRWSRKVASMAFVPAVTGLTLASEVVRDLLGEEA